MKIIITDLTRFANPELVCIAGINPDTNECVRPMPYIKKVFCREQNILPGAIIEGDFTACACSAPHMEDQNYSKLMFRGPCSSEQFKKLLENTRVNSIEEGFGIHLPDGQKHIPYESPPNISIITLPLNSWQLEVVEDQYKRGNLRVNFTDKAGKSFRFLSITDLGFFEYAGRHAADDTLNDLNHFIHSQENLYIRLGLARNYKSADGRNGFWLQVNGIYTFPEFFKEIRCYA